MGRAQAGRNKRDHPSVTWRIIGAITIGKGHKRRRPEMQKKRVMLPILMMLRDETQCSMTL